jgi:2,3-bisphosphoglycerate-independent phosphoglycerate mutase
MALLSDGGVHAHIYHLKAVIKMAIERGVQRVYIHAFTDGRDVAPKSAQIYIADLERFLVNYPDARIATIVGRYFALDRDNRWDRVERAFNLVCHGEGEHAVSRADLAIEQAYARGETDEFITPVRIGAKVEVKDGDAMIFVNYRFLQVIEMYKYIRKIIIFN